MGCGCGGGKAKKQIVYTSPEGKEQVVATQQEAVAMTRKHGGKWRLKQV